MSGKINKELVIGEVDASTMERMEKMIEPIKDYVKTLTLSSNLSDVHPITPPSGFSITTKYNTPIVTEPFNTDKFFSGVSLYRLPADTVVGKTEEKFNTHYIHEHRKEIADLLKKKIKTNTKFPFTFECMPSNPNEKDAKYWEASLSGSNSFVGIFSSRNMDSYYPKKEIWLAVQSGVVQASKQFYDKIEKFESLSPEERPNWSKFFLNNDETSFIREGSVRNRERLLAKMAKHLNLSAKTSCDNSCCQSHEKNKKIPKQRKIKATLDTFHYSFTDLAKEKMVVYHSNTTSPSTSNGNIIMENPYKGCYILKGNPSVSQNEFGGHWEMKDSLGHAFPTCTGRIASNYEMKNQPPKEDISNIFKEVKKKGLK
jgi:hypothetical protein